MAKAESCHHCVYSQWDRNQAMWTMSVGVPARPTCGNQPDFPGRMKECPLGRVCRNFRPRPPTPQGETVKTIPLGKGFYAYVDATDFEWLNQWTWQLMGGYAARRHKGKAIYMHREIMQPPDGMVVDHKNRNKLDNTRANLRACTQRENTRNREKRRNSSSRFKGVYFRKDTGKWRAVIRCGAKPMSLGYFTEEIEAARARDRKAVELSGELAWVNLPEEWPPQRRREVHAQFQARRKREGGKGAKGAKGAKGKKAKRKKPKTAQAAKSRATPKKGEKAKGKNKKGKTSRRTTKAAGRTINRR
jgi:hypothetical protein